MAHGQNAERNGHPGREYCSRRLPGMSTWGKAAKLHTHRRERRRADRQVRKAVERTES